MTLPQEIRSKIIAEARQYAIDKEPNEYYVDNVLCSYADGATEWAGRAQGLVSMLETTISIISAYIQPDLFGQGISNEQRILRNLVTEIETAIAKYKEVGNG